MDNSTVIAFRVLCIVVTIVIILICRELVAWYNKTNIQIANQKRIIELLEELLKSTH